MRHTSTRLLSLFVVVFLCLNLGAFFCLAHCNAGAVVEASTHCPLKRDPSSHCHRQQPAKPNTDDASFAGNTVACCVLPVGVFAAPLEKKAGSVTAVALAAAIEPADFAPVVFSASRQLPKFHYRPPPNDTRFERVRNQVFRI